MQSPNKSIVKVINDALSTIHEKTALMRIDLKDSGGDTWLLTGEIMMPIVAGMSAFATQMTLQSLCVARGHDVQNISVTEASVQRREPDYLTLSLDIEIDK